MIGTVLPIALASLQVAPALPNAAQVQRTTIDWATLPDLPYRQPPVITAQMNAYVKAQSRLRDCPIKRRVVDKLPALRVEVAVLVHPEDGVRTSVPRAAGCPVVEQYAAGLVTAFSRNNLTARTAAAEQWYRASVTFVWR